MNRNEKKYTLEQAGTLKNLISEADKNEYYSFETFRIFKFQRF